MAWSWSHSIEGLEGARAQVEALSHETLAVIYAEWKANPRGHFHPHASFSEDMCLDRYERMLAKAKRLPQEVLAEKVWDLMERQSTCTNGGWEAWCCPYGCAVHMVPFESPEESEES